MSKRFVSKDDLEPLTSGVRKLLEQQSLQDENMRKLLEQQSLQDQNMKRLQSNVEKITKALAIRS